MEFKDCTCVQKKEKFKSFSRVHVLHKARRGLAATAKKCTKLVMHLQTCCSANPILLLFCRSCSVTVLVAIKATALKPQAFSFLHLLTKVC